jgi:hypothetical protein
VVPQVRMLWWGPCERAGSCLGKPTDKSGGGRAGQLNYLRAGKHPRTREMMPPSIDENGCIYKPVDEPTQAVSRDQPCAVLPVVPAGGLSLCGGAVGGRSSSTSVASGKSSAQKMRDRLERVREKERETKRVARLALPPTLRLRGKQKPGMQWDFVQLPSRSWNLGGGVLPVVEPSGT